MESDVPVDAPKSCPGTSSLTAGKTKGCEGCPNQKLCTSGGGKTVDSEISSRILSRLENIKNILIILSGKGGVGKSSVASCIAYGLTSDNLSKRVGILDIDITGPSIPTMLGCQDERVHISSNGWSPIYVKENLSVMSVGFSLKDADQPIIWGGPRKIALIQQMLSDVNWSEDEDYDGLDFLLIDTPPGTTDEHMSIVEYLKNAGGQVFNRTRAIIVTTPQEVALSDVRKQIGFCHKVDLSILGVVSNMDRYNCSRCQYQFDVFPSTTGGVEALCKEYNLGLLASLPLDSGITWCLDNGISTFVNDGYDLGSEYDSKKPRETSLVALEQMVGNIIIKVGNS